MVSKERLHQFGIKAVCPKYGSKKDGRENGFNGRKNDRGAGRSATRDWGSL